MKQILITTGLFLSAILSVQISNADLVKNERSRN